MAHTSRENLGIAPADCARENLDWTRSENEATAAVSLVCLCPGPTLGTVATGTAGIHMNPWIVSKRAGQNFDAISNFLHDNDRLQLGTFLTARLLVDVVLLGALQTDQKYLKIH
jgi:hypothetical protein